MAEFTPWANQKLASSALPPATIHRLRVAHPAGGRPYSEQAPRRGSSADSGGIVLPYWTPAGEQLVATTPTGAEIPFERLRLSDQLIDERNRRWVRPPIPGLPAELQPKPKSVPKYLSPRGCGSQLYHSHLAILGSAELYQQRLSDVHIPLRLVEGEFKVEALTFNSPRFITIGLGGVWNWKDRRDGGETSSPIPELNGQDGSIPLEGREVRLCFDSDVIHNPKVQAALKALAEHLNSLGAIVVHEVLPTEPSGQKNGPDDLIHRHGPESFELIQNQPQPAFEMKTIGRGKDAVEVPVYLSPQEPGATNDSHRRAQSLLAVTARTWAASSNRLMHQWTGTHWTALHGDRCEPAVQSLIHQFRIAQGWKHCDGKTITSWRQEWQRGLPQSIPCLPPDLQAAGVVPCRNGLLRMDTLELIPHDPAHGNTWRLEVGFNPTAQTGRIRELLEGICGIESTKQLMAAIACTLRGTIGKYKLFFEIFGPGDCGKSLIALIVQAIIGLCNSTAGTLERLEDRGQRFETSRYDGQRLAIFNEAQRYSGPLETLKAFTGRDLVPAERKNGELYEFIFNGLVLLIGNSPINAQDSSDAVLNRRRQIGPLEPIPREKQDPDLLYVDRDSGELGGHLVGHLPGFLLEILATTEQQAREILSIGSRTDQQLQNEVRALTKHDPIAAFIESQLIFDSEISGDDALNIGDPRKLKGADPTEQDTRLFIRFMALASTGEITIAPGRSPISYLCNFKDRVVGLLRDQLGLPLPPGPLDRAPYKRASGITIPCLRWRTDQDDRQPGAVSFGVHLRHRPGPGCRPDADPLQPETQSSADLANHADLSEVVLCEGDVKEMPSHEMSAKRSAWSARSAVPTGLLCSGSAGGLQSPSNCLPGAGLRAAPGPAETIDAASDCASPAAAVVPDLDAFTAWQQAVLQHRLAHPGDLPAVMVNLVPGIPHSVTGRQIADFLASAPAQQWLQANSPGDADAA